jgi:hypothetical protein
MKVKELIEELQKLNGESEVVLQRDAEGNGYSPLCGVDGESIYVPDSTWSGQVYPVENIEDYVEEPEDIKEILKNDKCVVLWPIN